MPDQVGKPVSLPRSTRPGYIGFRCALAFLAAVLALCLGSLPWTLGDAKLGAHSTASMPRYNAGDLADALTPPRWATSRSQPTASERGSSRGGILGTDTMGRSLATRCLLGGSISLTIGIAAAAISVTIGTLYGAVSGYLGGRTDATMMRIVDVLYGLPYVLLVVLLGVASDAAVSEFVSRQRERAAWISEQGPALTESIRARNAPDPVNASAPSPALSPAAVQAEVDRQALAAVPPRILSESSRTALDLLTLLVAIGGVSWLTLARVVRGQVLSLKSRPFVEAARAIGAPPHRIFTRHLLPNLVGPIVVYATLTVPQAMLQESFLSFLGIGVRPPLPSWGNLASEGLAEINPYESHWWLLLFPCILLAGTLISLNVLGEHLRAKLSPHGR